MEKLLLCKGTQMMNHIRLSLLAVSIGTLLFNPLAHAAGFQFYELGAPINGTAGVGQAVITSDASTSYYNPAGMAVLPSSALLLGPQIILPYTNFTPHSSTTITGNNGGNAASLTPGASGYFVYNATPKLKFGTSLTTPYGGSLNYNDHWVGRFVVQQMLFYTLNLNPVVAYQINDCVAIGGGFSIEYANLYQTVALPFPLLRVIDGQATVKVDNVSPGFNLGVLFTPSHATKIGIAYRTQIIHNFRGNLSFFNIAITPSVTTKLIDPANIIASISQEVTNQFTLLGELGWSNWSSMTDTILTVHGFSSVQPQNWHDTYRIGLAGKYKVNPSLLFQAGVSYDSSPTSSSRRTPNLPVDRQIRVGTGIQYAITNAVDFGVSYEYFNLGNASINNTSSSGVLSGSYSRNYANVFQASLNVNC
jgi:long-chain fatty acid transport protein